MWIITTVISNDEVRVSGGASNLASSTATDFAVFSVAAESSGDATVTVRQRLTRLRDDSATFLTTVNPGEDIEIPYPSVSDPTLWDTTVTTYGGAGGNPAVTSLAGSWHNIALHEFVHSAFGLADEYDYWAGCTADAAGTRDYHSSSEPSNPNDTVEKRADYVKWRHLFYPGIAIPTTVSTNCTKCDTKPDPFPGQVRVGLYEGAHYYHCSVYRPVHSCMMRNYAPFCPVCSARILQVLQPNQPGNSPPMVFSPRRTGSVFSIEVPSSVGKNYQLEFSS